MAETFEKLALFLDKIKSATFWDRVLPSRWRYIRSLSYDAHSEYKGLIDSLYQKSGQLEDGRTACATLRQENEQLKSNNAKFDKDLSVKLEQIAGLQVKIESLSKDASDLREQVATLKGSEANMLKQYQDKIATLDSTQKRIEQERKEEQDERHSAEIQRIASLKDKWSRHQETVKETIMTNVNYKFPSTTVISTVFS